jgi:F420-non-reducing hydrogenase large subunit
MKNITFEPLRWQEDPTRVTVFHETEHPKAYFQVIAPREVVSICKGRPVEELPRILAILSPAHHLTSAMALDNLFGIEPPPLALNMREALLHTHVFRHHLRKLYFLLSSWEHPFLDYRSPETRRGGHRFAHHVLDEIMHHVSLSQEAAAILGGRCDHPLTAVAGGVSRFLKEESYERLSEIAESCLNFALRVGDFFRSEIFGEGKALDGFSNLGVFPMASFSLKKAENEILLRDGANAEIDLFSPDMIFQRIGLHHESWTHMPFAYIKGQEENPAQRIQEEIEDIFHSESSPESRPLQAGDPNPNSEFFFVGPLARLNSTEELGSPLAEEERQRLIEALGPFPHFSVLAAYWSLLVELFQAAEKMKGLYDQDKLTGPAIRTIPSEMGQEGHAALESPQGLIYHHYRVDERGLVEEVEVLDSATENNALRCILTQKAVEVSMALKQPWEESKNKIEMSLLPF